MKFALASYGTRGDVEPCVAIGRELVSRGHEVCMAVSPDLVGLADTVGLSAVAYGPDARRWQDVHRDLLTALFRNPWKVRHLAGVVRQDWQLLRQCWEETSATLKSLADGADLVFTGVIGEPSAANVAEYFNIPLATLHTFPMRPNAQLAPGLPASVARSAMRASDWLDRPTTKKFEDAQRRELGLPRATGPSSQRVTARGSLEIQAYDEVCFPGLAVEWAKFHGQRPFVGALTVELPTDADDEVTSWSAAGTPPIFFGFGSTPVQSPADTLTMISAACEQLGERALICAGETDFHGVPRFDHIKVVRAVNYAAVFPVCRAVVHHGGGGTTAAGLRAGVPTLILPTWLDQRLWGAQVKQLKVGTARRFSAVSRETLVTDLSTILAPQYVARAREVATRMTESAKSVTTAADHLENLARLRRVD
ncbi:glycosyl transferase family 1 [Mycolicibacterium sp. GF69]|uniref:glycosyltransferase n=1 Tax=Mycolicibacterium sp. GF69 TaxID=2267251 RepID=UPI000DCC947A|nr:glycosyltransferase [Mycolicibacterium sp. GF69]RAV13504.1 glycosyl transferase family 1 [Mycolicibacterium sp. GF69]